MRTVAAVTVMAVVKTATMARIAMMAATVTVRVVAELTVVAAT